MSSKSGRRFWTDEEKAFVLSHAGKMTAEEIGARLNRPVPGIYGMFKRLGLRIGAPRIDWQTHDAALRRLNALGYSDAEIAAETGLDRRTLQDRRNKLGLPSNALNERHRRRVAEKTAEQLRKAGLSSLGELRSEAFRQAARACGWPEDLRPRSVQILNELYRRGPMTRRQIADAIGMPWKGSRNSLHSNDAEGTYLAHLMRRGLVIRFGRLVKGSADGTQGSGKGQHLYALAPEVEPALSHQQEVLENDGRATESESIDASQRRSGCLAGAATAGDVRRHQRGRRQTDRGQPGPEGQRRRRSGHANGV